MRQRRKNASETLPAPEEEEEQSSEGGRFFACYLLTSRCPRFKGHTYIGFTVNPRRRIRQHNGEIGRGAWRTKKKRPWEMALCIYGFPTNTSALQFEWAWQNPYVSKAVRKAAANFKSLGGFANKIKLAYTMLTLPPWESLNLTVNFFSTEHTKHAAGCPRLPEQMKVKICPMDELPSCISEDVSDNEDEWCKEKDDRHIDTGNRSKGVYAQNKEVGDDEWYNDISDEAMNSGLSWEETLTDYMVRDSANDLEMGIGNTPSQFYGCNKEAQEETTGEFITSPVRMPYSNVFPSFNTEVSKNIGLFDDSTAKLDQPAREQSPTVIAANDERSPSNCYLRPCNSEVVDLITPSPLCRNGLFGKKSRAPTSYPEIIDLTKSPNFIQL
ncbi:structure-specific endonuclease subunit slx1 isoform X2 [Argentina anserina]|uniref:structure-specific endonuclease subunit slx1 isoform X2 n=1 Tax=Argentina anserina TaxID=57926 RepID=UPI00217626C6|nr:structure-specific endonuclease subunit slx1 isoform X2 [Potentilla anserina]